MNRDSIHTVTQFYLHKIDVLRDSLESLLVMAHALRSSASNTYLNELEKNGQRLGEENHSPSFYIPANNIRKIEKHRRRYQQANEAGELPPRLILISLINEYNSFIKNLLLVLFKLRPRTIDNSEHVLKYKDLLDFQDIEEARQTLARQEAESIVSMSHYQQIRWLEQTFNLLLKRYLDRWPEFTEIMERGKLLIRHNGVISQQYVDFCRENNIANQAGSAGHRVTLDRSYLINAHECLYESGMKVSQIVWRRILPEAAEQADASLAHFTDKLLNEEKYDLAARILKFGAESVGRHSSDNYYRTFIIKLAQALKFNGHEKAAMEQINQLDWSACGEKFLISVEILRNNHSSAAEIMKKVGSHGAIQQSDYFRWPIFKQFRESDQFRQAFIEIFNREPGIIESHPQAN